MHINNSAPFVVKSDFVLHAYNVNPITTANEKLAAIRTINPT